jgi:iron only hydrogenase large subunit-like protein
MKKLLMLGVLCSMAFSGVYAETKKTDEKKSEKAKKLEAKEDYPELDILVLTYKEVQEIFDLKGVKPEENDYKADWDIKGVGTQLYPISGGLAQSSCLNEKLTDPEMDIVSGPKLVINFLEEFENEKKGVKLLDILSCDGGCINGPGVITKEPLSARRQKVIDYWKNIAKCG